PEDIFRLCMKRQIAIFELQLNDEFSFEVEIEAKAAKLINQYAPERFADSFRAKEFVDALPTFCKELRAAMVTIFMERVAQVTLASSGEGIEFKDVEREIWTKLDVNVNWLFFHLRANLAVASHMAAKAAPIVSLGSGTGLYF